MQTLKYNRHIVFVFLRHTATAFFLLQHRASALFPFLSMLSFFYLVVFYCKAVAQVIYRLYKLEYMSCLTSVSFAYFLDSLASVEFRGQPTLIPGVV